MTGASTVARRARTRRGPGRRSGLLLLSLGVPALAWGCFASGAIDAVKSAPTGTLEVVSASLGRHTLAPSACASGERQLFLGADFLDGTQGLAARLILEPSGTASLRLFPTDAPLEPGLTFGRQDCERFDLSLERTGWQINDVYDLRLRLGLDCRASSGDSVRGELTADHCHLLGPRSAGREIGARRLREARGLTSLEAHSVTRPVEVFDHHSIVDSFTCPDRQAGIAVHDGVPLRVEQSLERRHAG